MATASGTAHTPLPELVDEVEGSGGTLTLYNATVPAETVDRIVDHFEVTTVSLEQHDPADDRSGDFAVLHDDGEFVAACGLAELWAAVDPAGAFSRPDIADAGTPALLDAIDQSTFREYGKRRMILASRDAEKRAWRVRSPALHVGFQEFRRLRTQLDLYRRLAEDLTVHLYGVPDWEPPIDGLRLHGYPAAELRDHWFVVYEPGKLRLQRV
jgi:DICT domain-containing protein